MTDQPLAARMRPRAFDEFVGQEHLLGPGKALTKLIEGGHLPSLVLWGPAGTGKTTLAHLLADAVGAQIVQLSAVSSGVADARKVLDAAKGGPGLFRTVLFVDEVHRWSKTQQDVLLPGVEDGTVTLIGATTENPYFSLNTPLLSRSILLRLEPLEPDALRALLDRALTDEVRGLGSMGVSVTDEAREHLVELSGGDARVAPTGLEAAALAVGDGGEIDLAIASDAVQKNAIVYDRQGDAHYDVISAFIKSIRGSDPDATLFWLARMLEAGEDPRYIARRLVVHASEDIGLADSRALLVAVAAAQAVEHVGMPEVRLNLAHAALYLARAPKSNSVIASLGAATQDARSAEPVPLHLRDAHYKGAEQLGHGKGYRYPHDAPGHWVEQAHRPARFEGERYYEPSGEGEESVTWHGGDRSE
ncbi:MAG: replication-associated recombination protein A [Actinomycetota bacterium]